jgi:hypothetical protein
LVISSSVNSDLNFGGFVTWVDTVLFFMDDKLFLKLFSMF